MATYFKYAERSADSQVDWAEIGKNMTDMLREENRLREDKKAAIDESTRKYAEELSNAPQGEHVGAREEALRFADDASKYMLMQERLLKQGLLNPRDYMIARQNLVDGTKKAFGSMKAFQTSYAELMERAKTDVSSAIELKRLETVQGYGNFRESGFFIDAPTGGVNVGLKEYQDLDGKKVMGLKQGSTRGMQYIDGAIYGRVDKFKYLDPLTSLANTYGEEIRVSIDPATMSKLGSITSISDLRQREDIDPDTKKVLFHYMTAVTDAVNGLMANPLQRGSLLIDTMGYDWTDDPEEAAKNPRLVLEVIDPNTGRGELKFTEEQEQASTDFMVQQFLGMVDRKQEAKTTSQVQRQDEPEWKTKQKAADEEAAAAAGAWNQLYTGKTAADKRAAAEILLGTPIAQEAGLLDIDMSTPGEIRLKYVDSAKNRTITYLDKNGNPISLRDFAGKGVELHNVVDRNKAMRAGGGGTGFGKVGAEELSTVRAKRAGQSAQAAPINVPLTAITQESGKASVVLQSSLPPGFKVVDKSEKILGLGPRAGNDIEVTAPDGIAKYTYSAKQGTVSASEIKKDLEAFVKQNTRVAADGEGVFENF
jgi:hypothetical protein